MPLTAVAPPGPSPDAAVPAAAAGTASEVWRTAEEGWTCR